MLLAWSVERGLALSSALSPGIEWKTNHTEQTICPRKLSTTDLSLFQSCNEAFSCGMPKSTGSDTSNCVEALYVENATSPIALLCHFRLIEILFPVLHNIFMAIIPTDCTCVRLYAFVGNGGDYWLFTSRENVDQKSVRANLPLSIAIIGSWANIYAAVKSHLCPEWWSMTFVQRWCRSVQF